ncbi:MAG: SipW-dependent-type signal peptide-containing protein [Clostridia bacterium]|nr:SipW-dependent-type signal peptide-containing protein [Clostridia bacterium]
MKRTALMFAAIALILCGIVGGTVAWLSDTTEPVVNTFTYGDIDITLEETDDGDGDPSINEYDMVPGKTIDKDPVVTVLAESENAYVFVKIEESADFSTFMEYTVSSEWTPLDGYVGVYYLESTKSDSDVEYYVLEDNKVKVKDEVTKEMLNALTEKPTLTFTAYAVQRDSDIDAIDTPAEAWALAEANQANG